MGGLFSKKKKDVSRKDQRRAQNAKHISSKDRVVLDLKNARDRLKKYQHSLEKDSVHLHETARALLKAGKKVRLIYRENISTNDVDLKSGLYRIELN